MIKVKALKSFFLPRPIFTASKLAHDEDVLGPIQERILTALLRLIFVFGLLTLVIGFYPSIQGGLVGQYIVAVFSIGFIAFLLFFSGISHFVRSIFLMTTAYIFLISTILQGLSEITFVLMFSFVVMVTLLIGIKSGVVAAVIAIVTLFGMNRGLNQEVFVYRLDFFELGNDFLGFFLFSFYWLFFVGMFVLTIWVYFDGFNILLKREQEARLQMEAERDLLAQTLEREKLLIKQLESSYHQVSELSNLKSQMINVVAHEFRTPLTVINSSSELFAKHLERLTSEKRDKIQKRISESVSSINQLLQDIENVNLKGDSEIQVSVSSISAGAYQASFERFIKNEFGESAIEVVWQEADFDQELLVDSGLIERILMQLVSNAVKFSPLDSPIEIVLDIGDCLTVCVKDVGIGIEVEDLSRIWEPFYRGENAIGHRGLGLGLSFASMIVDVLNGEITAVSSGQNQGAQFKVVLPTC